MRRLNRLSAALALAACASLAAPAAALDLPRSGPGAYDPAAENVQHRRWQRNRGVDAGDVIAGVLILGHIVGSYELDAVLAAGDRVRADVLDPVALALILVGALTKSAQFPFHFWLPHAMAAPTPVSA